MTIELRPVSKDELGAYFDRLLLTFTGARPPAARRQWLSDHVELDRTLGAFHRGRLVATAGAWTMDLSVPGATVPMAGVTRVSVAPTHRRQGLLRRMMRAQLDEFRRRQEPLAGLYASEAPIYGRFGYGVATWHAHLNIARAQSGFVVPIGGGDVEELALSEARDVLSRVYASARRVHPGAPEVPDAIWRRWLEVSGGEARHGDLQCVVHDSGSGPDGYVLYQVGNRGGPANPLGTLQVRSLIATTTAAYARLWRYCLDVDLIGTVRARERRQFEPLLTLLADPRAASARVEDGLWLRLVDVGSALAGRRYSAEDRLVLEVADSFCDWNRGRWELTGGPGGAECTRSSKPADLTLEAAALAACYLGGTRFSDLAETGQVEGSAAALARADAMFASTPAPWCPIRF
ncbi:MAG TPA: GNAT family N-acetyltransferase [Candidatus Dormibacteraeota bacterium]